MIFLITVSLVFCHVTNLPLAELKNTDMEIMQSELSYDSQDLPRQATPAQATPADLPNPSHNSRPLTATPSALIDAEDDIIYTESELREWLVLNEDNGGSVSLGAAITVTHLLHTSSPVVIDTGRFGLVFDGSFIYGDDLQIIGEGIDMPVVDVIRTNYGNSWDTSWNYNLILLQVTATGRNGLGGIAMRISETDVKKFDMSLTISQLGKISSYGKGAVGLWLDAPTDAYCYRVEVSGENSIAVYAPNGGSLYYCMLTAEGAGATTAAGNDVLLDTCHTFPEPDGIRSYNRTILQEKIPPLYLPLKQGTAISYWDFVVFQDIILPLGGTNGDGIVYRAFPIHWDNDSYDNIDTSITGKNIISGRLDNTFLELGLNDIELTLTVEVRPASLPCIASVEAMKDEFGSYFLLTFWESYDLADGNIVLWRSDDDGETWWDATRIDNIVWNGQELKYYYTSLEQPVQLVLEIIGSGESNTAILSEEGGQAVGSIGGDRTGTDREGVDPPQIPVENKPIESNKTTNSHNKSENPFPTAVTDTQAEETAAEEFTMIEMRPKSTSNPTVPAGSNTQDANSHKTGIKPQTTIAQTITEQTAAEQAEKESPDITNSVSVNASENTHRNTSIPVNMLLALSLGIALLCLGILLILRRIGK